MILSFCCALTFTLYTTPALLAQEYKDAELSSFFANASKLGTFNGNVLVADKGKIIYIGSIGRSDTSLHSVLTPAHRFHIGSIAKEFNAVAIMMLVEQGKVSLDGKLSAYLPELPAWAGDIRVLNLLQYSSGIPDVKWKTVHNDEENWKDLLALDTLDFKPGTRYNYNNNNVYLQRKIVARVSGMPFNEFVMTRMLRPAGIRDAVIDPTDSDNTIARAFSNSGARDPLQVPISGWTALNIEDFYRWMVAINQFKLISPASTEKILTGFQPGNQAGLGSGLMRNGKMIRHEHDGTARNYQALLVDYTSKGRCILLMTNNQQNNLHAIEKSISGYLDGGKLVPIRKSLLRDISGRMDTMPAAAMLELYKELRKTSPDLYSFDSETTLNEIGYAYLGKKKTADAILVFSYNTTLFPQSGNVFDSLAEAYYRDGNKPLALLNYKKALELDPTNEAAIRIINELK